MPPHSSVRAVGIVLAVLVLASLAGCSALGLGGGGGDGGSCGPGETSIGDLEAGTAGVTVTGEVEDIQRDSFIVDDGTGTAWITSGASQVSEGDCVTMDADVGQAPPSTDTDVSLVPGSIETE